MNTKLEIIFLVILVLFNLLTIYWLFRVEKRLKRFFLGKKGKDLEDTIVFLENKVKALEDYREQIQKTLEIIEQKLRKSLRGMHVVRFNPFKDQGSNQSFAIGLLDEEEEGVVISSLYSRERMSIFAKPIKNGKSEYELTIEEKEALEKAKV